MTHRKTSSSASVMRANAALVARGGIRLSGFLPPKVATALAELLEAEYATSRVAVIAAAILDAHKKVSRKAG